MSYPELSPHDAERIKELVEALQRLVGVQRDAAIKPGFTADIKSCGEAHKHPIYKIEHEGHITIECCSAHGTSISAARPSTGVLVEFNIKNDGQIDVAWGEEFQDLDAAEDIPEWLIGEIEWAFLQEFPPDFGSFSHQPGMGCSSD